MLILLGIWLAVAGCVAALAGLSGLRRTQRLRLRGQSTWAMTVPGPAQAGQEAAGAPGRPLLQYTLADGRVIERTAPAEGRKTALRPGQKVLIWYDPADPDDVLVYGRWGRVPDWAFLAIGAALILAGAGIAAASG